MERVSTYLLRGAVVAIGAVVLGLCVFALPAGIADANLGEYRYLWLGLYIPAIPFFFALWQTLKLLNYIDMGKAFSELSIKALNYIKYCAIVISVLFAAAMPYIYHLGGQVDLPGVRGMGLVIIFASVVIATAAGVLQKLVQSAVDIKSENDLTV